MNQTVTDKKDLLSEFEEFILENDHPCLMAQSVLRQKNLVIREYGQLGDSAHAPALLNDLKDYLDQYDPDTNDFFTFIAVFDDSTSYTEEKFEKQLWRQLQHLHELDPVEWDSSVDSDPESVNFSFSISGKAFYIVGMHPQSSRLARRSPRPCMVFNLHLQFEKLREMGAYEITRSKIRERDVELQGSANPMLSDFGASREAPQYSGRHVDESWKCPFHQKSNSLKSGSEE